MAEMESRLSSLATRLGLKNISILNGAGTGSSNNPEALLFTDRDGSTWPIEDKKVIDLLLEYPGADPKKKDKILNVLEKTIQKAGKDKKKADKAKQVNGTTKRK